MKRHAWNVAAFAWGLAEGTLFFIVPDVVLSYIALRFGLRRALTACFFAALGAASGGVIMYLWSAHDAAAAHAAVAAVPAISEDMIALARSDMLRTDWFSATLLGPLTRTPYKVYAILAPQLQAPLSWFAVASIFARLPRFLVVSAGIALVRHYLGPRIGEKRLTWALLGGWLLFYAAFFALTPN